MSYHAFTRNQVLALSGGDIRASQVQSASCDLGSGNSSADAQYKSCCTAIKANLIKVGGADSLKLLTDCKLNAQAVVDSALDALCVKAKTGVDSIDSALEDCCHVVIKGGGNVGERTKRLGLCTANAAANIAVTTTMAALATAACAAAGAVTAGITTALAATGICGIIGGAIGTFLYNRISGYSTGALIVGGLAAAVCGAFSGASLAVVCGFLAAELTQWLSDTLGPVLEKIFDPNAEARRKYEQRQAIHRASDSLKYLLSYGEEKPSGFLALADKNRGDQLTLERQMQSAWQGTITRLWDLYDQVCPDQLRRDAIAKDLRLSGTYHSLAMALVTASGEIVSGTLEKLTAEQQQVLSEAGALPQALPFYQAKLNADASVYGCEIFGRLDPNGMPAGYPKQQRSPICPPSFLREFIDRENRGEFTVNASFLSTSLTITKYKAAAKDYQAKIVAFFDMLPKAETVVTTRIASWCASQAVAAVASFKATVSSLSVQIKSADVKARAAADAAGKGNEKESAAAVRRAQNSFKVADEAYKALLSMAQTSGGIGSEITAATNARNSAQWAAINAEKNYQSNKRRRLLLGVTIAAGVAGSAYMMLRSNES